MNPYKRYVETIQNCQRCSLHGNGRIVLDRGNPAAKIVLIGEGPGEEESRTGECFVGAAGQFLGKLLARNGIREENILFLNVVKHRAVDGNGKNTKPKPTEIRECMRYLLHQLYLVDPEWIVLLGATAASSLSGKPMPPMGDIAGKFFDKGEFQMLSFCRLLKGVYCQFHPSAGLHDPGRIPPMDFYWKRFAERINGKSKD